MDVGHAAGAANAAAAAAHVTPHRAPVEEFVPQVEASTESSADARHRPDPHTVHVLTQGNGHKHGVIKHLSDADLAALVSMAGVLDPLAQVEADVDETQPANVDLVEDVVSRSENVSAFSERVTQNLLAEAARRQASTPVEPSTDASSDGPEAAETSQPATPSSTVDHTAAAGADFREPNFPDPTLAQLLREAGQPDLSDFSAPEPEQVAAG